MAELETKRWRSSGGNSGTGSLTGMDVIMQVFHFLNGPADVLRAATVCHRWRELAMAEAVWKTKAVREGIVEKAGMFEMPLPAAAAHRHKTSSQACGCRSMRRSTC